MALTGRNGYLGGSGNVWIQHFGCKGNESTLLECSNTGWKTSLEVFNYYRCNDHMRDASVNCYKEIMGVYKHKLNFLFHVYLYDKVINSDISQKKERKLNEI